MNFKNIIEAITAKGVIGTVLKSGTPPSEGVGVHRGKLAIILGAIAAALGYAANYL